MAGFVATNCLILNPLGLHSDREKGSEASGRIIDAAITTDIVNSVILSGGRGAGISILSLIADDIAGIEDDKYYVSSTVDECIDGIRGFTGFLLGSAIANVLSCGDLKTDGILLGDPLPSI